MDSSPTEQRQALTHLEETPLLDYYHPLIEKLIESKGWKSVGDEERRVGSIYDFIRDEIAYGYTKAFDLSASEILEKGYGNCITKGTLFLALLRAAGIPCRFHTMIITKVKYRGLLPPLIYKLATSEIHHALVEIFHNNTWYRVEGHIVDKPYLLNLQAMFPEYMGSFYGYGLAVLNFRNPANKWNETHTFMHNKSIEKDLGLYSTPDGFFGDHPEAAAYTRSFRYRNLIRPRLNRSIMNIRRKQLQN